MRWLATLLLAQGAWAQVAGVVLDPADRAVPNARLVLAQGPDEREAQTGAAGEFRFDNLAEGSYQLRVEAPGFDPIRRTVRVAARPAPRLTLRLALASLREQVTVSAETVRVNTDIGGNRNTVSVERGLLDNLPILDLDYIAALARFLDPSTPGSGGPSLIVDGMEARNVGVTASAIQEIRINQNPYTVEYPRWSRRRIEVITKAATDRYHGTLNFLLRDHHLNARDAFALTRPPEQRRIWEGSLFGPLGSGKTTSFLLSGTREDEDLQTVVYAQGLAGAIIRNAATPQHNTQASLRITRQLGQRHAIFWQLNYQDRFQYNQGVGGTTIEEAGTHARFREDEFVFNHRGAITPKLLTQFRILIGRYWAPIRSNAAGPRVVVSDAFTGGGAQGDRTTTEFHTSITWLLTQTIRGHTLKYGFNVPDWSRRGLIDRTNRLGAYFYGSLDEYRRNLPFALILQSGEPKTIFIEKNVGGFFQDEWQVRPNLSVAAGLRYDWQNRFGDVNNFGPRAAFAYAPGRARSFVIRGGAGFFFDRSGPAPVFDLLRYDGVRLRRYVVTGSQARPGLDPAAAAGLPTSIVLLDSAAGLPDTAQFSIGFEQQLAKRTTLAVNYIGTRGVQQFRSRDANAPLPPGFSARPDARYSVVRQIESAGRVEGNALEVTVRGTLGRKLNGLAQYNFGRVRSDTGGVSWFPADSFDPRGEWGRADTDRRHQFNLLGTATLHRWVNLGVSASLLSGAPFNITTGRDENGDGLAGDRPAGVTRNTGRGPGMVGFDLRWYREFRLKPAQKDKGPVTTVSLDAFNLLNRVNYQNYVGAVSSPFYGRAVGAQPPRRLQAGFRFQF